MADLLAALRSGRVLVMDGAMGTELQRAGLKPGECGELWNLSHPEKVRAIHRAYVAAGAEVLLTNTFQASPAALERHKAADQCEAVCRAAVSLAREAAGPERWVLADVGPCSQEEEWESLPDFVRALTAAGPDAFLVETCSDVNTLVRLLKALGPGLGYPLPVFVSFTCLRDREGRARTIGGLPPRKMASWVESYSVAGLGVNCGRDIGLAQLLEVVEAYRDSTHRRLFVRPNAGTPRQVEERWVYPHTPEYMATWLPELLEAGVSMVGGCCGTTPEHIAAFRPVIDKWNRRRRA